MLTNIDCFWITIDDTFFKQIRNYERIFRDDAALISDTLVFNCYPSAHIKRLRYLGKSNLHL